MNTEAREALESLDKWDQQHKPRNGDAVVGMVRDGAPPDSISMPIEHGYVKRRRGDSLCVHGETISPTHCSCLHCRDMLDAEYARMQRGPT